MVRYKLKNVPPGLPPKLFTAGFQDPEVARVVVGKPQKPFHVPLKHLCALDHFSKALQGGFIEGQTKVIYLEDDNEETFAQFLDWLDHGFPSAATAGTPSSIAWARLYVILDRWLITDPLLEIAKRIWNSLQDTWLRCMDKNSCSVKDWEAFYNDLRECYQVTEHHPVRHLIVHRLFQANRVMHRPLSILRTMADTNLPFDLAQWSWLMARIMRDCATVGLSYDPDKHETLSEEKSCLTDSIVMPLLFKDLTWPPGAVLKFPTKFSGNRDPREWSRGILRL